MEDKTTMTIKQIAEIAEKSHQTVGRWIESVKSKMDTVKSKMDKATPNNPAQFNLAETIAIIRAGGNQTLADLLLENATSQYKNKETPEKLLKAVLNGAALDRFMKLYGKEEACKRLDFLMGYEQSQKMIQPEDQPVSKEEGGRQFALIKSKYPDKYERAGRAIAENMRKRDQNKAELDKKQMELEDLN
ncbi:hypothetical protein GF348_09325 [candidate division KSB3 bacterium]|nr:hypothetical protein [candidate division KSB3 bacterium]